MSQTTQKRLPSIEAGAEEYAVKLSEMLRCEQGWRKETLRILRQEYARFVRMTIDYDFDVLAMWEYAWLVDFAHQYLRAKGSRSFWAYFHRKVHKELETIAKQLQQVEFDDEEKAVMYQAARRMQPLIRMWEKQA